MIVLYYTMFMFHYISFILIMYVGSRPPHLSPGRFLFIISLTEHVILLTLIPLPGLVSAFIPRRGGPTLPL